MPRLTEEQIKENVYNNSLNTCEYISGYVNRNSTIKVRCVVHNNVFETAYENVARKTRAHYICPICQQEQADNKKTSMICEYCGKEYFIPPSRIERSQFHFCSRECKDKAQRIESGDAFQAMRPSHFDNGQCIHYRKRAFQEYPHQCAVCGWDEDEDVLEVHHIDENRTNNSLENLIVLCPTCHKKLSTHKYELINRKTIQKIE